MLGSLDATWQQPNKKFSLTETVAGTVFSVMFFYFRPLGNLDSIISVLPGGRFAVVFLTMALIAVTANLATWRLRVEIGRRKLFGS